MGLVGVYLVCTLQGGSIGGIKCEHGWHAWMLLIVYRFMPDVTMIEVLLDHGDMVVQVCIQAIGGCWAGLGINLTVDSW